ncbi:bifunctional phosphopantothenoylcysteine decarboxylase/phosphopantothenate--cysteine ligase CoaBC [Zafaria sp. J156]|uniref:bifunctional phosphopantothenoylcysteine decarboxylase/phosphopantothenate--cysteine ligase CoaBC n=1 Tax=Zafaria sp. J156 TaxID=3116490 RepID=UPI002E767945|nr:bifunctional phosphopantothenoylcysteine decarboxylase/phosphopantothenate--cysteine ligase CoaBC [Zafaria sp. J156]MEE1621138.1 bifunctional phosphopantothenoylcysteine decarboxylase/phosphopantothenate--cysteine ligase CoaBC [Zafaria sp. J156]
MAVQQRIVLGVSGGIAAYKAASLLRLLKEAGHHVDVVPTANALRFVGRPTWEALSGRPVTEDVFDAVDTVNHVRLGQEADLVVVAPATADLLAKAAAGIADSLLANTLLASRAPVVMAPAMHTEMWEHPATRANVATLRARGVTVIEPASGRLTGRDSGPGRLPEPQELFDSVQALLNGPGTTPAPGGPAPDATGARPLEGRTVVVSAGGTREPLDPVRYLGNRSSGKQGIAVARAALAAGAAVRLVAAHLEAPVPEGVELSHGRTAVELREAVRAACEGADVLVMTAAVADFRPAEYAAAKIKKKDDGGAPVIELVRNPDILAGLVADRAAGASGLPGLIVGFAAETGDAEGSVLDHARAKLLRKGCELLAVNEVGEELAFGQDVNTVTVLAADGSAPRRLEGTKDQVGEGLVAVIAERLNR